MNPQAPTAAVGVSVTGMSSCLAVLLAAWLKSQGHQLDEPTTAALVGAITMLGHALLKSLAAAGQWLLAMQEARACKLAKREPWTPEQRAAAKAEEAKP